MFNHKPATFALLVTLAICCHSGHALGATANLDDLLLGDSLDLGSVTITNFTEIPTGINAGGAATPLDPALVAVTGTLNGDQVDVNFVPFIAAAAEGGFVDYAFTFDVTSTWGIIGASLIQTAGGPGSAFVQVTETINYPGGPSTLITNDSSTAMSTVLNGTPTSVQVVKEIRVESTQGTSAQISALRQSYVIAVPEPSTLALAAFGLIAVVGNVRRRRR